MLGVLYFLYLSFFMARFTIPFLSPAAQPMGLWPWPCAVQGEDLRAHSDDEEAAARKLEESRKRRAAMMTQADSMTEHRSRNDTKHVENMNSIIHMTNMI